LISALTVGSYATSVSVSTAKYAADAGLLTNVYFESSGLATSTTPSVVTAITQPGTTGSTSLTKGSTDYLYSPSFGTARNVAAGTWIVEVWAATTSSTGTMTITIDTVNSGGTVQAMVGTGSTTTVTTTKAEAKFSVAGSAVAIPASGYLRVSLYAPTGSGKPGFTVYWGKAQGTNFQVPMSVASS